MCAPTRYGAYTIATPAASTGSFDLVVVRIAAAAGWVGAGVGTAGALVGTKVAVAPPAGATATGSWAGAASAPPATTGSDAPTFSATVGVGATTACWGGGAF